MAGKITDVYGKEVWSYFCGNQVYEFLEREDGFQWPPEEVGVYFYGYPRWDTDEKKAISFAKGRVLDIGTGAGRVALYLQQRRFKVTAIDRSPLAVNVCKARGVKDSRLISLEQLLSQNGGDIFDTVVMFGNNFGLFESPSLARRWLDKMRFITSPEAVILAQSASPYRTRNPIHLHYYASNKQRGKMAGQFKMRLRLGESTGDWFNFLFVSKKEMRDLIKGTGWKIERFFDSGQSLYSDFSESIYTAVIKKEK